ncbi:hypothetical protein CLV59_105240 [Chitinophaga dinghuensis]|uniref:ERF1-like protein n=1 Tax=Chitinophaga dinghuensis TaxID=1539050 RepID=A0A327VXB8_9BACT|nr:hypothetical protein [Chitinophaga dinghuensis]RAJ80132.1 hypothetical protein CLV59_105240 [Chitinophaga dinghuensis]
MQEQDVIQLSQLRGEPAVTVLISTHRTFPDNKRDSINLKNLVTAAEKQLYELYDKRAVWPILEKIKEMETGIDHRYNLDSLVLYASENFSKVYNLPVDTTDRIIIGKRFEIRPLLKALQDVTHYYAISVSRQKIRLLEADNETLIREIHNEDFPFENTNYYTTDPMKLKNDAVIDDLIKEYFNVADKRFKKYYHENPLPVVLMGDTKMLAYYQEQMDIKGIVIGTVNGSFDDTQDHDIPRQVGPVLKQMKEKKQEEIQQAIATAQSQQRLLVDLSDIYRAAVDGSADTLYVENTYFQPGTIHDGAVSLHPDEDGSKDLSYDVLLPIIETILSKSGKVVFVDEGALNEFQGIALSTRF